MAKNCVMCGKQLGLLEKKLKLTDGQISLDLCTDCGLKVTPSIDEIAHIRKVDERSQAANDFAASDAFDPQICSCIAYMALDQAKKEEPSMNLTVVSGQKALNLGMFSKTVTMKQDSEGRVYFNTMPGKLFYLNDYTWDGPLYKTVTTSIGTEKTKTKDKTKKKGGLGGAVVGAMVGGPVGLVAGYGLRNGKKTKGKGSAVTKSNVVTDESQEEIDSTATIQLRDPMTGTTFSFGITCNSKINVELDCFDWSDVTADDDEAAELAKTSAAVTSESEKIALLKQYKELLDAGVITQEEFDEKKKSLIG